MLDNIAIASMHSIDNSNVIGEAVLTQILTSIYNRRTCNCLHSMCTPKDGGMRCPACQGGQRGAAENVPLLGPVVRSSSCDP